MHSTSNTYTYPGEDIRSKNRMPFPIVTGGFGLMLAYVFPGGLTGGQGFLIGFVTGTLIYVLVVLGANSPVARTAKMAKEKEFAEMATHEMEIARMAREIAGTAKEIEITSKAKEIASRAEQIEAAITNLKAKL